jgi:beta-glucosidase
MGFQEGGARAVMASYNAWNGTTMVVNPILKSIARDKWGVDILSSDGQAVHLLVDPRHLYPDQKAAVVACLKAGVNQFLDRYKDETLAALKDGSVTEAEIDALIRLKFRTTIKLGLLDPPDMVPYSRIHGSSDPADTTTEPQNNQPQNNDPWNSDRDRSISQKIALESVVLLKNEAPAKGYQPPNSSPVKPVLPLDRPILPLDKNSIKSIAVIGPLADSVHWDWYGGTPPYKITPLDGIKAAVGPNVTVNYAADESGGAAVKAARTSDVAIVVVGNDPTCGPDMGHDWYSNEDGTGVTLPCTVPSDGREGRDREIITLAQEQLVKQVYTVNPRTIVILVSSFPFAINWSQEHVPAILHMAHASQDEGTALARVLFGDANPGGHLTVTWPKSVDQLPPMMDYNIRDGRTYMYFKGDPLYPFGYGLSYTTFKYTNLRTSSPQMAKDGSVTVSVDVTNTGSRAGDAVVQLYVKHLASKVTRPNQELKGFQRVTLQPGETKTVAIPLKASSLAWWDEKLSNFRVEAEPVKLMVGNSSSDIQLTDSLRVQ